MPNYGMTPWDQAHTEACAIARQISADIALSTDHLGLVDGIACGLLAVDTCAVEWIAESSWQGLSPFPTRDDREWALTSELDREEWREAVRCLRETNASAVTVARYRKAARLPKPKPAPYRYVPPPALVAIADFWFERRWFFHVYDEAKSDMVRRHVATDSILHSRLNATGHDRVFLEGILYTAQNISTSPSASAVP